MRCFSFGLLSLAIESKPSAAAILAGMVIAAKEKMESGGASVNATVVDERQEASLDLPKGAYFLSTRVSHTDEMGLFFCL